jgi:uncharacterized peroxidase-related enzyme
MSWIAEIPYEKADSKLKSIYDRVKGPDNTIDNVLSVHSLRPHTLVGHMTLYKNVLHNSNNTVPKWFLETLGVYVSHLNSCKYCVEHHFSGLQRLLQDDVRAAAIRTGVQENAFGGVFEGKFLLALAYAEKLTKTANSIQQTDIEALRASGFSDGEILEINQVISYFNYVNRSVLGLGVNLDGDILGLSPKESAEPDNWSHS